MSYRRPFGVEPRNPLHSDSYANSEQSAVNNGKSMMINNSNNNGMQAYVYKRGDVRRAVLRLSLIFIMAAASMYCVYCAFPQLAEEDADKLRLPASLDEAKVLGRVLSKYKDAYFMQVLIGMFITYVFLQTFAIPGSLFLSILCGYLFPFPIALLLVCTCSAIGATFCYFLSSLAVRTLLHKYMPHKVTAWAIEVNKHRDHLFNYIVFLRITPFLPNWFINLAAPIVHVTVTPFFLGTFFGVMPPSVFAIQGGQTLQKMTNTADTVTWRSIAVLAVLALLSIAPAVFKSRLRKRIDA